MSQVHFDDLIVRLPAPPKRGRYAADGMEDHLYEGAVILAYAMHLMRTEGCSVVDIHPDGEHGKQFDFSAWLQRRGFTKESSSGRTSYGGTYRDAEGRTILIEPTSGLGDVVAAVGGQTLIAECKGGLIATQHPGQVSRLRKGLCEAVGLLMARPSPGRQVAVVPYAPVTCEWAARLAPRCAGAGIELALLNRHGEVIHVGAP
ncbi:MAG TPA: hypothetical protein VNM16_11260 [Bacillota bacterium]|nr:hypothetical protein [Bacillota bacterium]